MNKRLFFLCIAACALATSAPSWTNSQPPANMNASGFAAIPSGTATSNETMIVTSNRSITGNTQMSVIDSRQKTMAVYEIDGVSGAIQLKSVRNMNADFLLDEFNGTDPTPEKVRGILANP